LSRFCGWVDATVTEDVLENADEVPGQFLLDSGKKEPVSQSSLDVNTVDLCTNSLE